MVKQATAYMETPAKLACHTFMVLAVEDPVEISVLLTQIATKRSAWYHFPVSLGKEICVGLSASTQSYWLKCLARGRANTYLPGSCLTKPKNELHSEG
jgi:hypothetical protein